MATHARRTKIVSTIGPASSGPDAIRSLVAAGMDAARLNFSHGTQAQHAEHATLLRQEQEAAGRPLALIADLQGPKLRIGALDQSLELRPGDTLSLVAEGDSSRGELVVSPPVLAEALRAGDDVLIDDGRVRIRVTAVAHTGLTCEVMQGGVVSSNKGVNVPGVVLPVPSLTEKDERDLEFALSLGVDYVALSFVRSPDDVHRVRALLNEAGSETRVIAKIEKAEAFAELGPIIEASDAVMVARGDLGVEIGAAAVPLAQKRIIDCALELGKPAITATQMLESMLARPEPTRAEASDVANAILDGSAAMMLSGETAIGPYPVESVAAMDQIARAVEPSLGYRHSLADAGSSAAFPTVPEAVTTAACDMAELLSAGAILVPTFSGRTASDIARHRPRRPIIASSHRQTALQQLALEWGVVPRLIEVGRDIDHLWLRAIEAARDSGLVRPGDRVVITGGTELNVSGSTNVIKVATA